MKKILLILIVLWSFQNTIAQNSDDSRLSHNYTSFRINTNFSQFQKFDFYDNADASYAPGLEIGVDFSLYQIWDILHLGINLGLYRGGLNYENEFDILHKLKVSEMYVQFPLYIQLKASDKIYLLGGGAFSYNFGKKYSYQIYDNGQKIYDNDEKILDSEFVSPLFAMVGAEYVLNDQLSLQVQANLFTSNHISFGIRYYLK